MKRYIKMRPRYANGADLTNIPFTQVGNLGGQLTENLWDDEETADGYTYQGKKELTTSNALRYAGTGAAIGTMIAPGIGTAIGAGVGAIGGAIYGNIQGKKNEKLNTEAYGVREKQRFTQGLNNYYSNIAQGFEPQGNYYQGKIGFKKGGRLPRYAYGSSNIAPEYEVENQEIIEGNNVQLENGKQIGNNLHKAIGATHEEGGILGSGGDRVFSARSKVLPETKELLSTFKFKVSSKDTHASLIEKLANKSSKFEEKESAVNPYERNTAKLMLSRYEGLKEIVFADQEIQKQFSYGSNRKFKLGGQIDNTINPDNEIILNGDKSSLDRELPAFSNIKEKAARIKPPVSTGQEGKIKDYLVSKGLTDIAAYGIMGNIGQESNFYSNQTNPNSGAYGLYQHLGERKDKLFQYAKKQNKHYSDAFVQTDFALQEIDSMGLRKLLNAATTPEEAAQIFHDKFERPEKGSLKLRQDKAKKYAAKYMFGGNLPKYGEGGKIEKKETQKKNAVILYSTGKDKKDNTFKIEAERAKPVLNKKYGNTEIIEIPYGNQEELKKVLAKYKDADIFPFDHSGEDMMGIPVSTTSNFDNLSKEDYKKFENIKDPQERQEFIKEKSATLNDKSWSSSFSENNNNCVYWGACEFSKEAKDFTKYSNVPSVSTNKKKWQGVGNTGSPINTEDDFLKQMYYNSDYQYNKPQQKNVEIKTKEVPKIKEATVKQQTMLPMFKYGGRLRKYSKGGQPPIKIASWQTNNSDISDNPYYDNSVGNAYNNRLPQPNNGMLEGYVNNQYIPNFTLPEMTDEELLNSPNLENDPNWRIKKNYNKQQSLIIPDYIKEKQKDNYVNAPSTIPNIEIPSGSEKYKDNRLPSNNDYEGLPNKIPNPDGSDTPFTYGTRNSNSRYATKENSFGNARGSWGTGNSTDYSGDVANTLALATNLASVNSIKPFNKPTYLQPPVLRYKSNLPLNLYNNAMMARYSMKNASGNSSVRYGTLGKLLNANNEAISQDNVNRSQFNNQVASIQSDVQNKNAMIDNDVAMKAVELNNQKNVARNDAVNTWAVGERQNKYYRDQLKLEKESRDLIYKGRYGNVDDRLYRQDSKEDLNRVLNSTSNETIKRKIEEELEYRKKNSISF